MTMRFLVPVGALAVVLTVAAPAHAGQRDSQGRDRNGRATQGRVAPRDDRGGAQPRAEGQTRPQGGRGDQQRSVAPAPPSDRRSDGGAVRRPAPRSDARRPAPAPRYDNRDYAAPRDSYRGGDRDGRRDTYRYAPPSARYRYNGPPRLIPYARAPRHYYGPGGSFSVYFRLGRGYLYGAPYYGRVYGYVVPRPYDTRIYYGDVRLEVRPRDAAVYVDGYYAGIVDDFDGVFQRLTLEAGPHQIEVDAPGLEPQLFEVYVDPARSVTIHADLYPY